MKNDYTKAYDCVSGDGGKFLVGVTEVVSKRQSLELLYESMREGSLLYVGEDFPDCMVETLQKQRQVKRLFLIGFQGTNEDLAQSLERTGVREIYVVRGDDDED